MATILVVEDEQSLQRVLEYNLRQMGHEVVCAGTGEDALRIAHEIGPDLVLLDILLPDVSGTEVCKALKRDAATRDIPIIFVTAKGDEVDRVVGFELGASDYVVKPYSVRELTLRVAAVLRRTRAPLDVAPYAQLGRLRIDEDGHRVWVDGQEIELTLLEFRLLVALFEGKNRVLSRSALLDGVWGIDVGVTTRTVDTHIKRLRDKLGPAGEYIQTVRGVGYRFTELAERAAG